MHQILFRTTNRAKKKIHHAICKRYLLKGKERLSDNVNAVGRVRERLHDKQQNKNRLAPSKSPTPAAVSTSNPPT